VKLAREFIFRKHLMNFLMTDLMHKKLFFTAFGSRDEMVFIDGGAIDHGAITQRAGKGFLCPRQRGADLLAKNPCCLGVGSHGSFDDHAGCSTYMPL
jgi:hypothetical protein